MRVTVGRRRFLGRVQFPCASESVSEQDRLVRSPVGTGTNLYGRLVRLRICPERISLHPAAEALTVSEAIREMLDEISPRWMVEVGEKTNGWHPLRPVLI